VPPAIIQPKQLNPSDSTGGVDMGKNWYRSKSIWFGVLVAIVSVASLFGFAEYQPDAQTAEIVGLVVSAVVIVLRLVTREPVVKG